MRDGFPNTGQVVLPTAADTQRFAEDLARYLRAGDVVILDGPVGTGKTTFTPGSGAGVKGQRAGDLPDVCDCSGA